jgi:hypothetical protein
VQRSFTVLLAIFLLTALLASPVAAQAPSPSPSSSPVPAASLSPEASALAVEAQSIVAEVFAQTAESPEEAAAAARAAEIERTGLAEIDPELPTILAELEAQAAEQFATFLAEALPLPEPSGEPSAEGSPGASASPEPDAETSPQPSPEAGSSVFLAATAPGPRGDDLRFAQGGSYVSSIGDVLGAVRNDVSSFEPSKSSGSISSPPYVRDGSRYRIVKAWERDTLTIIIERTERYSVPGTSPESPPFEVTDSGGTTLQVDTCPDEGGTIVVTANASGTYDVVGEGLSYHASLDTNDHATVTVDDEAEIAGREHALAVRGSAIGDRPAFAGGEGAVDSQLAANLTWSGATTAMTTPSVNLTTAEGVDARDLRSAFTGGAFTAGLVDAAIGAARQVWRSKKCLELKVEPPGKTVDPGSETEITVKIEQKAHEGEIEGKPVTATLEGTKEVHPLDEAVPAPAAFKYTATDAQEGEGTITFRSVSERGIAERTETYRVDLRLLLDAEGTVTYRFAGGSARGALSGRGLVVKLIPGDQPEDPPGVTVTGNLQVQLQASTPGCSGEGTKRYPVDTAVDASAKVVGEGDARQLSVLIRPAQPSAQMKVRVQCEGRGVTMSFPLSILFPHFERGAELLIPIGGGQASRSANVQGVRSKFTFTLRREQMGS